VGSAARLKQVVETVAEWIEERKTPMLAVVVSAQGNTTDWLLDAADYAVRVATTIFLETKPLLGVVTKCHLRG
jgi:aspartokinase